MLANTLPGHHPRQDLDNDTYIAHSLRADGFDASEDGTGRGTALTVIQDVRGLRDKKQNGIGIQESETMYTLDGTSQHGIAWEQRYVRNGRGAPSEIVPPLKARSGEDGRGDSAPLVGVRRLTPVECERLQGFPDGWTDVGDMRYLGPSFSNRGTSDGPRYKALGNAVTVPVIEWLGRRIANVLCDPYYYTGGRA